jgi:16S rRNA (guanine527-N7)-methyltransferase
MNEFINKLFSLITVKYAGINLTRINSFEEFKIKQIDDSLKIIDESKLFKNEILKNKILIDVGFGGGFPLLPLAYTFPEINFLGIELRQKKINVVSAIAEELGLKNIKFYHGDVEKFLFDKDCVVTLKAVGKILEYNNKIHNLKNCTIFHFKGPQVETLEPEALSQTNLIEKSFYSLDKTDGRSILAYQLKNVPRGTDKFLVKLSDFF